MRKFIAYLLLGALLGMITPLLLAQQNQNPQKSDAEIEILKKRVSELEKQLQAVENVEKMELQAKLAEANAKLADAEFGKFERALKNSNDEWLRGWSSWFLGIIGVFAAILIGVGAVFWFWLRSTANKLIADTVEKNLDGFKEAVDAQDVIKNELRVLKKEHAASMLEDFHYLPLNEEHDHPEQIKVLSEEDLLQVFEDENYRLALRYQAATVLTVRKFPRLTSHLLKFLNLVLDSDSDIHFTTKSLMHGFVDLLGHICTLEAYQGLKEFFNRLLTASPKHKDLFLMQTVLSLVWVGIELDMRSSVSIVREAISHFETPGYKDLDALVEYFDRFNEPEGIKEILTQHVTDGMPDVEDKCLELLQKHDLEFVEEWRAQKVKDNSNA